MMASSPVVFGNGNLNKANTDAVIAAIKKGVAVVPFYPRAQRSRYTL